MNHKVDKYLADGCLRCPLGGTSGCKVHQWPEELSLLRAVVLECGLTEELKWGVPCYTFQNKNVLMVSALRDFCAISFFKGTLLKDAHHILVAPGENSRAVRYVKFNDTQGIIEREAILKAYIYEAIEIEKAGLKVDFKKNTEPFPKELENKFEEDPVFKSAFEALTKGRQRGYILYFTQPKQSKTRTARIEKCMPKILNGEGLHDKVRSLKK
ncbi:YdeI/OmpD-associated family protein [Saccharicrinis sp. GN24d3]|uniref:YdeI/OmpD-associated family protein n=1 Tax=Saccharicrinis sp. GN24d3 TaxID=3458416 RepID=UPI0040374A35